MNKAIGLLPAVALVLSGCVAPASTPTPQATASPVPAVATSAPTAPSTVTPQPPPTASPAPTAPPAPVDVDAIIEAEMQGSFRFFWEQANTTPGSPGFGLIRDRYPGSGGIASIASVGFGLTAYVIGVEKGYITRDEGYERADRTLDTLLTLEREEGFYYHFLDLETGKRAWESEVSSIDTAILLMGVLTAGEYFGDTVAAKAATLYDGVNFPWFLDEDRQMFYMAYRPEKGFEGHWDFYAEQLMLYVLAAGSRTHPTDAAPYEAFTRHRDNFREGPEFIHSWFGSIFTYQFSHAWIDFRGYTDADGVDWYQNSVDATLAQYEFAVYMDPKYETLGPNAWGLSASDGPDGYNGLYGAPPSGFDNRQHKIDDTVPPYGAVASIVFAPEQAKQALLYYASLPDLQGPYGFVDAFNLTENWFDTDVIGIDKGVSLLMLANYQGDFVYRTVMNNQTILTGLDRLGIRKGN